MKSLTAIFRRKPRPDRPAKRPARSLGMSFAALESRGLLTIIGPIPTSAVAVSISAVYANLPTPPMPSVALTSSNVLEFGVPVPFGGGPWNGPGNGPDLNPASPVTEGDHNGTPAVPYDPVKDHVALSAFNFTVNGVTSSELALADAGRSEIRVRLGSQVQVLGAAQGIDHPQSVLLANLGNGGSSNNPASTYPDLIVANSGGNNILVFPGLAGGRFGPAINGINGFAVGQDPVNVSFGDINNDGIPDLIVANRGSNSITILQGQANGPTWNSNTTETINVGNPNTSTAPVKAIYLDVNHDGMGDIIVCNSGSNNVYIYNGIGGGAYDTTNPTIMPVGTSPNDMVIGRFGPRPQLDLVTVNSGSDDLTEIDGIFTTSPTTRTISSGGMTPDAAFAYTSQDGMMGLVVANSGDGRLALLQPGISGLQIAGVVTSTELPIPTALASSFWGGSGLEFLAATAGQDAATLLHFDLGLGSPLLATPGETLVNGDSGELIAGLMPFGDSSLELIAVYWIGSPDQAAVAGSWSVREPSSITAYYSPTESQGDGSTTLTSEVTGKTSEPLILADPNIIDRFLGINYVLGVDLILGTPRQPIDLLAADDLIPIEFDGNPSIRQVVQLDDSEFETRVNPDVESFQGSIDEAIRLPIFEGQVPSRDRNTPTDPSDPARRRDGIDTSALEGQYETVPLLSSIVLFSARLILKASPPRPASFRRGSRSKSVRADKPRIGSDS